MPWNPKRNKLYRALLRGVAWIVATIAASMAWQSKDIVGGVLAAALFTHLLTTNSITNRRDRS
jgi:hypothetical protein